MGLRFSVSHQLAPTGPVPGDHPELVGLQPEAR